MSLGNRCKFAKECEVFQGKKIISETPLPIFRNVFCNRGIKGWKNCEKYNELSSFELKKNYEFKR